MVTQEEEDAQKGEEESDGLHVVPVHRELHLGATKTTVRMRSATPIPLGRPTAHLFLDVQHPPPLVI